MLRGVASSPVSAYKQGGDSLSSRETRLMQLVAVVVNYRTAPGTLQALPLLLSELRAVEGRLILIDNDSGDGSYEALCRGVAALPDSDRVEVVESGRNGGFGFGNNIGVQRALKAEPKPKYLLFINPDAVPKPGAVATLVAYLDAHPRVAIAGGALEDTGGERHPSAFRFPSALGDLENGARLGILTRLLERWVVAPGIESSPDRPDWVSGAYFMIRAEVLEQVGTFDEGFFLYFEETELCHRVRRAGWEVAAVSESVAVHDEGTATGIRDPTRRVPKYWFDSRRRFFLKVYGPGHYYLATVLWALGFASFRLRRRIQRKPDTDPPGLLLDFLRYSLVPATQQKAQP